MARHRPNGHAAPYEGADGWWHCYVTVGTKPDGKPDRKHIRRRTDTKCSDAVDELRRRIKSGERSVTKAPTVAEWLEYWLEEIVRPNRAWKTYEAYRPIIRLHLVPAIGQYRLGGSRRVLQPEHVEAAYDAMREAGYAPKYVLQAHRVLSRALKVAHRRGRAARNVCDLIDGPSVRKGKPQALELEAVRKILLAIVADRMRARWLVALMLGLRQGEVLGLRWRDLILDGETPRLQVRKQAQRRTWQHGCTDPAACAARKCRTQPCPPKYVHGCADASACKKLAHFCPDRTAVPGACSTHRGKVGCPPPCAKGCTRHGSACPKRRGGGIVYIDPKSEEGVRTAPLDAMLVAALVEHRRLQRTEWLALGLGRPGDDDLVFTSHVGKATDPRRDHEAWERVLAASGLPDAKLHAARHTAATLLVATGTDIRVVQEVLGHSDIRVTQGYTDVAADMKRAAVDRLSKVLFGGALEVLVQPPGATGTGR